MKSVRYSLCSYSGVLHRVNCFRWRDRQGHGYGHLTCTSTSARRAVSRRRWIAQVIILHTISREASFHDPKARIQLASPVSPQDGVKLATFPNLIQEGPPARIQSGLLPFVTWRTLYQSKRGKRCTTGSLSVYRSGTFYKVSPVAAVQEGWLLAVVGGDVFTDSLSCKLFRLSSSSLPLPVNS